MRNFLVSIATLAILACTPIETAKVVAVSDVALAKLADANGKNAGVATLSQRSDGLWLSVAATEMKAGTYGIHLHAVGKCDAPDFATAGPHWNPAQKQHGFDNPMGAHGGDLRNLVVNREGIGAFDTKLPDATATGEGAAIDADGLAIIIHEKADDYSTDPSGNSGKRMICGVFTGN